MKIGGLGGSDLHKYHSSREWALEREGMISGHGAAGVVAVVGAGVKNVAVGDRICVYHCTGCGHCNDCLSGLPNFCAEGGVFGRTQNGSHADFMLSAAWYCLPLPDSLSFAVGTQLACTAVTAFSAFSAVSKIHLRSGRKLVVFGLGPVGLAAYLIAIGMGYETVGVDLLSHRVE